MNVNVNTKKTDSPTMLVILDGLGYSSEHRGNAVYAAHMPFWSWLLKRYPHTLLHASGEYVGLLPGYIGNSEVGHLTIGAGRVVESILKRFHKAIKDGSFFSNPALIENFKMLKQSGAALHLMGLLSDGGVHSHEYHLHAILKLAMQVGLKNVFIHAFLDGRDVAPQSAGIYLQNLQQKINEYGIGCIASLSGRFYAMDRDKNWDRTEQCYKMLVECKKDVKEINWQDVLKSSYECGITDEFVVPIMINSNGCIKQGDGIVFFNFRPDRACQLAQCFLNPEFNQFEKKQISLQFFISSTRYKAEFAAFNNPVLFENEEIKNTFFDVLAKNEPTPLQIFIIAETEKYAHVTYFFRGMVDKQLPNEMRVLVPSIKVKNYVNNPEMSAAQITNQLLKSLQTSPADFYLVNYANPDMVGHSGDMEATVKACQCVDKQIEQLYGQVVESMNGTMFITADHGNAEEKINLRTGQVNTAHTTNPVPFIFVNSQLMIDQSDVIWPNEQRFGIASIAPTILKFLRIQIPDQMNSEIIEI